MSSEEVVLNERGSLLNFNDELLVSVFLWLLEPEDVTHRHILPITKPITNISSVVDTNGDEGEVVMTSKEESGPDRGHLADTPGGRGATTSDDGIRTSAPNGAQPLKAAVLTGREVLRSLCSRTRRIIDSLCGVLSVRLKDLVDGGVVNDYDAPSATLPSRITCLNYIFDLTGVHSTSLRGPLNTIVNFINTTTYTPGEAPSRTTALLTPPARVHLLNINPWMLEPSGRCIRDVFGVVRDIEENNKSCFAQREGDAFNDKKKTRGGLYASRRIEIVRMTLSGFIIHQQELPPLKITLNNLHFLSLTYCTIPLSGHASPVAVRQVPWLPSMPLLESLELRHMIAVDASGGSCGTMAADQGGLSIGSTELADALLEGILHRLPSLKDLFIDSSASIVSPDIAANAPRLQHLTMSHCPRLRPISVEKAARECKGLKLLDIRTLTHLANEVHSHALVGIECLRLPPGVKEEYLKPILSRDRDDHRSGPYSRCLQSLALSEIDDIDLSVADASLQTLFLCRSERMPLPSISSFTAGQHLRYLSISFCRLDPARFRVSGTFSNLEILSLHNVVYSRNQLSLLLASTPSLTALDIALCDQATTRQRDANAPRDELEPLRVPGSNPPIPLKFPRLRYLRISGSKRVHYSAIVPSIISNASVLEQLELLKIPPVYSISSPSPRLASITVSLVPPTPSTRVRLVRDILNDSAADGGQKLLLQHYEKSEVDLFVAALTRQCWSMKSLVLSGCCLQQQQPPPLIHCASSHASTLTRMVREYEAMMGDESMLIPSGRDTRLMIVRDHIQAALNQHDSRSLASSQTACDTRSRPSSKRCSDAYDTAIPEEDGEGTVLGHSTSDDNHTPGYRLSDDDSLMLEVIIQQTTAVALGLLARLVAVNEIMYSTNQQQGQARAPTATTPYSTLETSPTPTSPAHTVQRRSDGRVENDDDDYDDDEDEALPQVIEMTSPTAMTPPSPDVADQGEGALPTPPPPSISVAPHPPALHTIQQLLLMHRMPMSGLELDAPVGSTEWDPCYKETMAVLMSAPVRMAFRILAGDDRSMGLDSQEDITGVKEGPLGAAELNRGEAACHNRESPERGHPSLSGARHRAVYEYGKAYQSMMDKFISMRTAQITVMSQLPERQQQQMLWKGLLIQSTGAYTREGAYSAKIMTHRKALLRYKQSPRELQDYLSTRRLVNEELAALLRRRLARVPQTDRWGARCRPPEDREVDIIAGCLRNALTPAGVIGGGIAILPLREGASYLPKLFENLPIHLMAPLLVDRLTASSSSPNTGYSCQPSADVGLVSQFCELMEMCISMHI
ncbi:hypothetical protein FOZ62_021767, partial [Perkinsus olseni]